MHTSRTSRSPRYRSMPRRRCSSCSTGRSPNGVIGDSDEPLARRPESSDEPLARRADNHMSHRGVLIKVSIFTVAMVLVAAGLVVVFGQFRFSSTNNYHAVFENASRLKSGNDVRIAGIPVGSVKGIALRPDNKVDVTFAVDKRYQMYAS